MNPFILYIKEESFIPECAAGGKYVYGIRKTENPVGVRLQPGKWDCLILKTGKQNGSPVKVVQVPCFGRILMLQRK